MLDHSTPSRNFITLRDEILERSHLKEWEKAKLEWSLVAIYQSEENMECLCGHYPIREICEIANEKTGHTVEVGNVCVKKFLEIDSNKIFAAVKRVKKDINKGLNKDAIMHFHKVGILND